MELTLSETIQSASDMLILENQTTSTQRVSFSALDVHGEDEQGNVQFASGVGGKDSQAVSYVSLATDSAVLAPGEKYSLTVTVKNSQELSPGGHYSALVARFFDQNETATSPRVQPAVSTLLLTRKIGGERYHISLTSIAGSERWIHYALPKHFELTFTNDGNIHLVPHGTISVVDMFGRQVEKGIINEASTIILPQNRRTLQQELYTVSRSLPLMLYTVNVSGATTPGDVPFSRQFSFIYVSSIGLVVLALFVILIVLVIWKLRRRRRSHL